MYLIDIELYRHFSDVLWTSFPHCFRRVCEENRLKISDSTDVLLNFYNAIEHSSYWYSFSITEPKNTAKEDVSRMIEGVVSQKDRGADGISTTSPRILNKGRYSFLYTAPNGKDTSTSLSYKNVFMRCTRRWKTWFWTVFHALRRW